MDLLTELRVPTRSAPRPPDITSSTSAAAAAAAAAITSPPRNNDMWSGIDPFSPIMTTNQKKKPPPRPPPPKFTIRSNNTPQDKPKNKPTRPTELITNLFGRRGSKSSSSSVSSNATVQNYGTTIRNSFPTKQQQQHQSQSLLFNDTQSSSSNGPISMCLIDLSPPGSPTPSSTTRSSSDGVSVDSFGSDGNSNPSAFTSGSSACSAFEDDFDFFGNLSVNGKKPNNHLTATASAASNDPWKVSCTQDPFGSFDAFASSSSFSAATQYQQQQQPQQQQWSTASSTASSILQQQTQIKEIGESNFFAFNDINTTTSTSLFDAAPTAATPSPLPTSSSSTSPTEGTAKANFVMPTIIRAKKPSNNKEPPPKPALPPALSMSKYSSAPRLTPVSDDNKPGWAEDASPPMPKLPPPPPPPEYMASLEDGLVENFERPYGVALYNFPATQPGDLELKEGDVVYLTKAVNDDWMEGCVGVTEGIFPANFIDVKVPLPGRDSNVVKALYDFNAETFDDLSFKEGATIKVLSRISDEWLYGECNGDKGQFPANFVDRVPSDLAAHL